MRHGSTWSNTQTYRFWWHFIQIYYYISVYFQNISIPTTIIMYMIYDHGNPWSEGTPVEHSGITFVIFYSVWWKGQIVELDKFVMLIWFNGKINIKCVVFNMCRMVSLNINFLLSHGNIIIQLSISFGSRAPKLWWNSDRNVSLFVLVKGYKLVFRDVCC